MFSLRTAGFALCAMFSKAAVMAHPETMERITGTPIARNGLQTLVESYLPDPGTMFAAATVSIVATGISGFVDFRNNRNFSGPAPRG